jgi:integrase/recombinase XerD
MPFARHLPIDPVNDTAFRDWVAYLKDEQMFEHDDALFPKSFVALLNGVFAVNEFRPEPYANASATRKAVKDAFVASGLLAVSLHSFRKNFLKWVDRHYLTRKAFKAFSQNIGQQTEATTVGSYLLACPEQWAELIRGER